MSKVLSVVLTFIHFFTILLPEKSLNSLYCINLFCVLIQYLLSAFSNMEIHETKLKVFLSKQ